LAIKKKNVSGVTFSFQVFLESFQSVSWFCEQKGGKKKRGAKTHGEREEPSIYCKN